MKCKEIYIYDENQRVKMAMIIEIKFKLMLRKRILKVTLKLETRNLVIIVQSTSVKHKSDH